MCYKINTMKGKGNNKLGGQYDGKLPDKGSVINKKVTVVVSFA